VTFAFAALGLSISLSVVTYTLVRNNLIREHERAATTRFFADARFITSEIIDARGAESPAAVLERFKTPTETGVFLYVDGDWDGRTSTQPLTIDDVPEAFEARVLARVPTIQRFEDDRGDTYLAFGVYVPAIDAVFAEIFQLRDLDKSLSIVGGTLVGVSAVITVAAAFIGLFLSRRVVRPLEIVATAASEIAGGRLDTRLDAGGDTDLESLTRAFNQMADALQARIDRDARFASDVSHELRSPLTTMRTSIELLESRRGELSERARTVLDLLAADVRRFDQMVQDLLEISRFDAGAASANLEEVRIGELVVRSIEASGEPHFPVDIDARTAGTIVAADKRRMERVIANLVQNARAHGGGVTRVSVVPGEAEHAGSVLVLVDDEGPGVPPADRERIFDRFARGQASRRRGAVEGTGLGLSLVAEHARLHRGSAWVEDRPGGGARFVVALPILPADGESS
jgi:two-component system, OmpR family, sensor histidine kinase MtrB